jgi:hypothetical protein
VVEPLPRDTKPPRTAITHRPPSLITVRRGPRAVAFRFSSNEPGARFRCRIDGKPYRDCAPPRRYRLRLGRHSFRVFAVDSSGNRDPSPAIFKFRIRRAASTAANNR